IQIIPYIHFSPVTNWESTEMFTFKILSIEKVPKFRTLIFGIPLSEIVSMRKEALFRTCFFFITTASTNGTIHLILFNGIQKGSTLQGISSGILPLLFGYSSGINRLLY